jgi:hypothetical protein
MSLADLIRSDSAIFFNLAEHAEIIRYNGVEITAVTEIGVSRTRGNSWETIDGISSAAFVWVSQDDVESPVAGDSIVLSDESAWEVSRSMGVSGGVHQLELVGSENPWGVSNARQSRVS